MTNGDPTGDPIGDPTTSGDVAVPASTRELTPPANPPGTFYRGYAVLIALLCGAVFGPVLYILLFVTKTFKPPSAGSNAEYVAGVVAVGLLAIGLAIGTLGVYLMLVEHRASLATRAHAADSIKRGISVTPEQIDALGKLKPPWAVMFASVAVLLASAWVATHIADSAKPATPTVTTAAAQTATTVRPKPATTAQPTTSVPAPRSATFGGTTDTTVVPQSATTVATPATT